MSRGIGRPVIWPPVVRHNGPIPTGPNGEGSSPDPEETPAPLSVLPAGPRRVEAGTMDRHSHKSHGAIMGTLDFLIDSPGCRPGDRISAL